MKTADKKYKGVKIRKERRLAIYLRDGLSCVYCGDSVEDGAQFSLDHLKPQSQGGTCASSNLVTACRRCNCSRGDRPVAQFVAAVAAYLNHGVTAEEITKHINNTRRRQVPMAEAKTLLARRGSVASVLEEK